MEIPVKQILRKMELEIQQALTFEAASKIREHILVVESLCELILEQGKPTKQPIKEEFIPTTPMNKQSIAQEDDSDANGESLFDF